MVFMKKNGDEHIITICSPDTFPWTSSSSCQDNIHISRKSSYPFSDLDSPCIYQVCQQTA